MLELALSRDVSFQLHPYLTTVLFNIFFDWVILKSTKSAHRIENMMNDRVEDLDFSENICIILQREFYMSYKFSRLIQYYNQMGLKINAS